jgi:hypothetical protein
LEKAESGLSNLSLDLKHNGLIAALLLYNATNSDHCEDGESDLSSVRIVNDQFAHLMEVIRKSEYSLQLPSDLEKFVSISPWTTLEENYIDFFMGPKMYHLY